MLYLLRRKSLSLLLALVCLVLTIALAVSEIKVKKTSLRRTKLPTNIEPIEHEVFLKIGDQFTEATAEVTFKVAKSPSVLDLVDRFSQGSDRDGFYNPKEIILHMGDRLKLLKVEATAGPSEEYLKSDIVANSELPVRDILHDAKKQMVVVRLKHALPPRQFVRLEFHYKLPNDLKNGAARQLFPCLDEPQHRSRLRLGLGGLEPGQIHYQQASVVEEDLLPDDSSDDEEEEEKASSGVVAEPRQADSFDPNEPRPLDGLTFTIESPLLIVAQTKK